jgi:hypothetical protein
MGYAGRAICCGIYNWNLYVYWLFKELALLLSWSSFIAGAASVILLPGDY